MAISRRQINGLFDSKREPGTNTPTAYREYEVQPLAAFSPVDASPCQSARAPPPDGPSRTTLVADPNSVCDACLEPSCCNGKASCSIDRGHPPASGACHILHPALSGTCSLVTIATSNVLRILHVTSAEITSTLGLPLGFTSMLSSLVALPTSIMTKTPVDCGTLSTV